MMKLQRPAPYFANALLAAVDVLYFSKYLTLRLRIRTSKLIIDKRILFNVRWHGRRYDFKICVQAKTVTKRKAPKQKLSELKTVVAPKTLERKTNMRWPEMLCLMLPQLLRSNGLHWRSWEFEKRLSGRNAKQ